MIEERIGKVTHYFPEPHAAVVALDATIRKGDTVHIVGTDTDLVERVESLQIEHEPVDEARAGQEVGLQVPHRVHDHSEVFVVRD